MNKVSIGDFQALLLKLLLLNPNKIKHASLHVSTLNILYISLPIKVYDQFILYNILIALQRA